MVFGSVFSKGGGMSVQGGRVVGTKTRNPVGYSLDAENYKRNQAAKALQASQAQANADENDKYNRLLASISGLQGQIGNTYGQAQSALEGVGTSARQRIADQQAQQSAASDQSLISRGLGNTTVVNANRRGIASDAERANQSIDEQVASMKSGLLTQRAGSELQLGNLNADAILSRSATSGLDMNTYLQLIQQLARATA